IASPSCRHGSWASSSLMLVPGAGLRNRGVSPVPRSENCVDGEREIKPEHRKKKQDEDHGPEQPTATDDDAAHGAHYRRSGDRAPEPVSLTPVDSDPTSAPSNPVQTNGQRRSASYSAHRIRHGRRSPRPTPLRSRSA